MFNFESSKKSMILTGIAVGLTLSSTALYYFKFRGKSSVQPEVKRDEKVEEKKEEKEEKKEE